ncbi:MAG: hypothetical protein F6K65_38155 [Moorea sp. SIO3C2]|nr:hypothetical protein [Moorena sp. SIO3C2]
MVFSRSRRYRTFQLWFERVMVAIAARVRVIVRLRFCWTAFGESVGFGGRSRGR